MKFKIGNCTTYKVKKNNKANPLSLSMMFVLAVILGLVTCSEIIQHYSGCKNK